MFVQIPRVLNAEQLTAVHTVLDGPAAPWVDGRATAGHQGALVKSNRQLDEGSATARELGDLIISQLERNPLFISAVLPNRLYPPMFNRYGEGMQFGTHVDGAVRQIPGTGHKMRTDLSATLFLTPPEAYDGGELVVDGEFGSQQAKLAAGDLIVYTSTSRHRVNPVTRGRRLASVFWIQSLIRDDFKREQLFELDRTIQQLTQSGAALESLVRLTGHYHSLLRLWSEV
jgi:PKHD-type hydroxylase